MIRALYRGLLWLHPPQFRRRFGGEMLWIFDQTAGPAAVWTLFFDGLVSLARQWLLRSGAWKLLAAAAGALLQVTLGGLGFVLLRQHSHAPRSPFEGARAAIPPDLAGLIYLAVGTVFGVICSVIVLAIWARRFNLKRAV